MNDNENSMKRVLMIMTDESKVRGVRNDERATQRRSVQAKRKPISNILKAFCVSYNVRTVLVH